MSRTKLSMFSTLTHDIYVKLGLPGNLAAYTRLLTDQIAYMYVKKKIEDSRRNP